MSDVNPRMTIEFKDEKLGLQAFTIQRPQFERCENAFVAWVRDCAFRSVENILSPSSRKESFSGLIGDIAAGRYSWEFDPAIEEENYVQTARRSPGGNKYWHYLVLLQTNPRLSSKDYANVFDNLWKNEEKRNELIEKVRAICAPTPPMPPSLPEAVGENR